MPKVSAKRQITIPIDICREAKIEPGDEVEMFIHRGQITILKQEKGAAKGVVGNIKADKRLHDEQSLQSSLD